MRRVDWFTWVIAILALYAMFVISRVGGENEPNPYRAPITRETRYE